MINGLHFDISAEELTLHLRGQTVYHRERAAFYAGQVANLEAGGVEAQRYTGGDPVKALRESLAQHEESAAKFAWLAEHVVEGETYRLSDDDLTKLGIVKGYRHW